MVMHTTGVSTTDLTPFAKTKPERERVETCLLSSDFVVAAAGII